MLLHIIVCWRLLTVLKRDKKAIVSAAALAAKAHQFIMGLAAPVQQEVAA